MKRIAFLLCLIAGAGPLLGQNYQSFGEDLAGIRERARWRLGPILIYPMIRVQEVGYDDNINSVPANEGPVADYRATLTPQIRAHIVLGGSLLLSFLENPEYLYYNRERSRRAFGNSISPSFRFLLLKRFVLSGSYEYQEHFQSLSREVNILTRNRTKGYHGEFFFETPRMMSLGISADISEHSPEDLDLPGSSNGLARELSREERSAHAELYYGLSPVMRFFVRGGYSEFRFKSSAAHWRDSYSWQAQGGIRFSPAGRIQGLLSLGYRELHPKNAGPRAFSGLFGNTELSVRLGRFTLRTLYSRNPVFSYQTDIFYFVDHTYGGGASLYLSQFIRIDYDFSQSLMDYPDPIMRADASGTADVRRNDRQNLHSAGIMLRLFQTTGLGISANYYDMRSDDPSQSYRRFVVGGYISYKF